MEQFKSLITFLILLKIVIFRDSEAQSLNIFKNNSDYIEIEIVLFPK